MKEFELQFNEKTTLKGNYWEIEKPKGFVVIMEGMEEHVSRYDKFAKFLNENGFGVFGLDTFGQGLNVLEDKSNIGMWPTEGFAKQVMANDMLVSKLKEKGFPVYIFAHSMGSFMAQDYMQRFPGHVEKIVLCGSGSKNPALKAGMALARVVVNKRNADKKAKILNDLMFGNFNDKIQNPRTDFDWLSFNEDNVNTYIADPLCGFGPRNKFCFEFLRGMNRLYSKKSLNKINKEQKILIISGSDDPVTNYGKSVGILKKMYNDLGINDVDTKIFSGMRHEILNENNNQEVLDTVLKFFA